MRLNLSTAVLVAVAALFLFTMYVYATGAEKEIGIWGNLATIIIAAAAAAALFYASGVETPSTSNFRFMLGIGLSLWVLGDISWAYYEVVVGEIPAVSIGDLFWLLGYIPILLAFGKQLTETYTKLDTAGNFAVFAFSSAVLLGGITCLLLPILSGGEGTLVEKAVLAFYPIGDVLVSIFAFTAFVVGLSRKRMLMPYIACSVSFILLSLADAGYTFVLLRGFEDNVLYRLADYAYMLGYLVLFFSAYSYINSAEFKAITSMPKLKE